MAARRMVRVLGPIQVVVTSDGKTVDLPSASQRRLLGVLAIHAGTPLRAEWLADALALSASALRTAVSRLRGQLGDIVESVPGGYQLNADVDASFFANALTRAHESRRASVSADRLVVLEQALSLWTGAPYDEFAHESWAAPEVARLTEIHAGAIEDHAAELIAATRWSEAIAELEAHIARHPFRDHPRGLLLRALAGAGRNRDALRAYQIYRQMLVDEVGTEPSPAVRRIEQRIAAGWDGIEQPAPRETIAIPLHGTLATGAQLVGRQAELAAVLEDLAAVRAGGLRTVLVGGEPGIGKTTFMAAVARTLAETTPARSAASTNCQVIYGRCDDGAPVPLQPLRTMIATLVDHAPIDVLIDHVNRCGGEISRIASSLSRRLTESSNWLSTLPPPTSTDHATDRHLLFDAITDLLRRVADRNPLVLLLDDVQWAEPSALLLLRHLARELARAPILVMVSYRDPAEPRNDTLRRALADLDRTVTRRLTLAGLTGSELRELVANAASGRFTGAEATPPSSTDLDRLTSRLERETAGNALFASQLIRHWIETGEFFTTTTGGTSVPPNVRDLAWSRVSSLGSTTAEVLSAAAVLGVEFSERHLSEIVDAAEREVDDALDAAVSAGLVHELEPATPTYRFTHALVAAALYTELAPRHRSRLHARAARALEKSETEPTPSELAHLARHCELAGLSIDAQRWCTLAGDHAFDHHAPSEAAQWYEKALSHASATVRPQAELADLTVRLGHALQRAGDPEAFATLERGAHLAKASGAGNVLIRAALATDRGSVRIGEYGAAQHAIVEAAMAAASEADPSTYCQVLALYAQCLIHTPQAELRIEIAQRALALARASDDLTLLPRVASGVLNALWAPGSAALRMQVAAEAVGLADVCGDPFLEYRTQTAAYGIAIETADHAAATRARERMRQLTDQVGEPRMRWWTTVVDTFDAIMSAELARADELSHAAYKIGESLKEPDAFVIFAGQAYDVGTFAGRHQDMFPLIEKTASENPKMVIVRLAYAILCTAVGREEVARGILAEGRTRGFSKLPLDWTWKTAVLAYAILAIELGDREAAAELLPMIEPFAAEVSFNGVSGQGPIAAYVGKLASVLGDHDKAEEQLLAALTIATNFGWHYHRASTLFALGQSRHRRLGHLDEQARMWLDEGASICVDRGLNGWGARISGLLERS